MIITVKSSYLIFVHVNSFYFFLQDTEKLIQTLKNLCNGDGIETDLFTSAQTVINLALMHVKNNCGKDMEVRLLFFSISSSTVLPYYAEKIDAEALGIEPLPFYAIKDGMQIVVYPR